MSHFTKYGKRMRLMLLTAMFVASMVCLFAIPFVEKNLLNNPQSDSYFVYFYEVGNKKCEKANEDLKKEMTIISNVYYFNIEDTTLKRGKDFDYKNVTDYEDITIKQVPMMIHVEDKKIDHVYYKASDIKKALE